MNSASTGASQPSASASQPSATSAVPPDGSGAPQSAARTKGRQYGLHPMGNLSDSMSDEPHSCDQCWQPVYDPYLCTDGRCEGVFCSIQCKDRHMQDHSGDYDDWAVIRRHRNQTCWVCHQRMQAVQWCCRRYDCWAVTCGIECDRLHMQAMHPASACDYCGGPFTGRNHKWKCCFDDCWASMCCEHCDHNHMRTAHPWVRRHGDAGKGLP